MRRGIKIEILAHALAACVLALGITACGNDQPDADRGAPGDGGTGRDQIAGQLTVLAAASLTDVFDEIGARFESAHPGVTVTFSFGASSELATQVAEGLPADVVATASDATMQAVVDAGLAVGPPLPLVTNQLAIAVPAGNPGRITDLADLGDADVVVALCAPQVPCGAAADALLDLAGVMITPATLEEDVRAALTKVELGEVDAALVYRTDVIAGGEAVEGIDVPEASEVINTYPVAALRDADNPAAAASFVAFLTSPAAQAIFASAGFGLP